MSIVLTINAETPEKLQQFVRGLASGMGEAVLKAAASAPEVPEGAAQFAPVDAKKPGRKKAPAAEAVIDATPRQADIEDVTGKTAQPANEDAPMLTIEDVRERTRQFAKYGYMDEVAAEMTARGIKKMSEVDPEAGNKPSAKFAEYVAAIESRIEAKPKMEC